MSSVCCSRTYLFISTCLCIFIYIVYIFTWMHACMHVRMYICMYVCTYVCARVCVCECMWSSGPGHTFTFTLYYC